MSVIKHKVLKLLLRFQRLIAPQIQQGHTRLTQKFRPSGQKKLVLNLGGVVNGGFALTCGCVSTEFDEIATTANPFWTFHQLHQLISHNLACQKSNNPLTSNEPKIAPLKHAGILCSTPNILFVLGHRDHKELKNTNMISSVCSLVCRM
jgi:hypothetical protein